MGTGIELVVDGRFLGELRSPLWGTHNLRNALGGVALCLELGLTVEEIAHALPRFRGVKKRQEIIGEAAGVLVIDDFAHHPTAVRETLRAIRRRFPKRYIWAVFEAKSNTTRRAVFQEDYPPAFDAADRVVLSQVWKTDTLPESERISIPKLVDDIRGRGKEVDLIPKVDDIVDFVANKVRPNDVVVGLSGSDFGGFHHKLVAALNPGR
jgi:UDP-N-acetylmuramate: L-alanyl-gamma-D-glutamyl-meso-diaminopimelate ligase